jgi:predicted Rossmann fold nucleotide-binding protein DprA/Smf involved in DNA uptake
VKALSEKPRIDPKKAKAVQERNRERNLVLGEMKNRGPSTIDELSNATGIDKSKLLNQLIAMRQFGKISVVGRRDNQLVYGLPEEIKS